MKQPGAFMDKHPQSRLYWLSLYGPRHCPQPQKQEERRASRHSQLKKLTRVFLLSLALTAVFSLAMGLSAHASSVSITANTDGTEGNMGAVELIFLFAFLSLLPSIAVMMTSFTRIVIVLSFMRSAIGTQQSPPNMVITGIAIFLTLMIMQPTISAMYDEAFTPFAEGRLTSTEALDAASVHIKEFMLKQMDERALSTFVNLSKEPMPEISDPDLPVEIPLTVMVPAFITSELTKAFKMGFYIFLPFLVVDMVVASILMSMGMVMLPPAMISMPFKLLLFVLVDGWNLMITTLVGAFR